MLFVKIRTILRYQLFVHAILLVTTTCLVDQTSMKTTKTSRQSLYKLHLLISSTREYVQSPLVTEPELAVISFGIIEKIILDILASHLGFTYIIVPPRDILSTGFLQPNGSWTGTTGQLQRKAWIAILVTFIVTVSITWIMHRIIRLQLEVQIPTLSDWIFFYFGLWASQSLPLKHSSTSLRTVCLVSIFGIYIIMNYLTASYTSILSTPMFKSTVNSVEDLAKSKTMKTLLNKGSSTESLIMSSSDPTLKKLGHQMRRYPERRILNSLTVQDIATIIKEDSALILAESNAESLIESSYKINGKCLVTMAEKTFLSRPQGFTYPKNSPVAKAINDDLLLMQQAGLIQYAERTAKSRNRCRIADMANAQAQKIAPLNRNEMGGSFVILAVGMVSSFFVFIAELMVAKMRQTVARKTFMTARAQTGPVLYNGEAVMTNADSGPPILLGTK